MHLVLAQTEASKHVGEEIVSFLMYEGVFPFEGHMMSSDLKILQADTDTIHAHNQLHECQLGYQSACKLA